MIWTLLERRANRFSERYFQSGLAVEKLLLSGTPNISGPFISNDAVRVRGRVIKTYVIVLAVPLSFAAIYLGLLVTTVLAAGGPEGIGRFRSMVAATPSVVVGPATTTDLPTQSASAMNPDVLVTAATVLFGFLFAGYWWALNRELRFTPELRHFKYGYFLLLVSMAILSVFGILEPLRNVVKQNSELLWPYRASVLVIIGVFGYMLTEFGHYRVFQLPKYTTWQERACFWATIATWSGLSLYWFTSR